MSLRLVFSRNLVSENDGMYLLVSTGAILLSKGVETWLVNLFIHEIWQFNGWLRTLAPFVAVSATNLSVYGK